MNNAIYALKKTAEKLYQKSFLLLSTSEAIDAMPETKLPVPSSSAKASGIVYTKPHFYTFIGNKFVYIFITSLTDNLSLSLIFKFFIFSQRIFCI